MESVTYLKNIKIAPKKLRFYVPNIKKMSPGEALKVLLYMHERPGRIFYQAIKSAVANAKNALKVQDDLLQFKALMIEEGQKLKRFHPGSRGSAKPYKKRFSHIKIIMIAATPVVPVEKVEEKKEVKKTASKAKEKSVKEATVKAPKKKTLKVSETKS
ncbi:MAG: hypothetical protein RI947_338 [Candidatus Parcubacteria bacterium]|jgi:large subunit ribosomal protein L22